MSKPPARLGIFIEGAFMPERDGASTRFAQLPAALARNGLPLVVFHCYRGWSDLRQISQAPFRTYLFSPEAFYQNIDRLVTIVRDTNITLIQMNDPETVCRIGYRLAKALDIKLIYEAHYHGSTLATSLGAPAKRIADLERLEADVCERIDHLIVFTESDRRRWILAGCDSDRISVVPFGVPKVSAPPADETNSVIFLGNGYFEPNRRAIQRFATHWSPRIRALHPSATFGIIGDLPFDLRNLCYAQDITLFGEVPDPIPLLTRATVGIAPITESSGVRVKILTYLSAGLPVVATSAAAEGLNFPALYVENALASAVGRCVDILQNRKRYREPLVQTHALLNSDFLWSAIACRARRTYDGIMRRRRRIPSGETRIRDVAAPMWLQEVFAKGRFAYCKPDELGNDGLAIAEHRVITRGI